MDPNLLDAGGLRVDADNFSIGSPGSDWLWFQAQLPEDGSRLYFCQRSAGGRFLVGVIPDASQGAADWFQAVLDQNVSSQQRSGRTVSGLKWEPSQIPIPGAYKWTAEVSIPDSGHMGWRAYAARSERVYLLQFYGSDPALAESFDRWASSFRILSPGSTGAASVRSVSRVLIHFVALAAGAALALLLNAVARRRRLNPGSMGGAAIAVVVVYQTVRLITTGALPGAAEAAGEAVGSLVGYALLPFLCAVGVSLLYRRTQRRAEGNH